MKETPTFQRLVLGIVSIVISGEFLITVPYQINCFANRLLLVPQSLKVTKCLAGS